MNSRQAQWIPIGISTLAGQRVQVIRRAKGKGGVLEFGTTVLSASDGTIAALLGASPGASTAVPAMMDVMERCFSDRYPGGCPSSRKWCRRWAPSSRVSPALFEEVWGWGTKVLKLDRPAAAPTGDRGVAAGAPIRPQ